MNLLVKDFLGLIGPKTVFTFVNLDGAKLYKGETYCVDGLHLSDNYSEVREKEILGIKPKDNNVVELIIDDPQERTISVEMPEDGGRLVVKILEDKILYYIKSLHDDKIDTLQKQYLLELIKSLQGIKSKFIQEINTNCAIFDEDESEDNCISDIQYDPFSEAPEPPENSSYE